MRGAWIVVIALGALVPMAAAGPVESGRGTPVDGLGEARDVALDGAFDVALHDLAVQARSEGHVALEAESAIVTVKWANYVSDHPPQYAAWVSSRGKESFETGSIALQLTLRRDEADERASIVFAAPEATTSARLLRISNDGTRQAFESFVWEDDGHGLYVNVSERGYLKLGNSEAFPSILAREAELLAQAVQVAGSFSGFYGTTYESTGPVARWNTSVIHLQLRNVTIRPSTLAEPTATAADVVGTGSLRLEHSLGTLTVSRSRVDIPGTAEVAGAIAANFTSFPRDTCEADASCAATSAEHVSEDRRISFALSADATSVRLAGRPLALAPGPSIATGALVLWGAIALFSRILGRGALRNERRRDLYEIIARTPGISWAQARRESGLGSGAFTYHVMTLERCQLIEIHRRGRSVRLAVQGELPNLSLVQRGMAAKLLALVQIAPTAPGEAAKVLGTSRQTVHYHLARLKAAGLVEQVPGPVAKYRATTRNETA